MDNIGSRGAEHKNHLLERHTLATPEEYKDYCEVQGWEGHRSHPLKTGRII